jgi:hypothetical protein
MFGGELVWLNTLVTLWRNSRHTPLYDKLERATNFSTINPSLHKMELWARFRGGRPHDPKLAWYSQEPSYMLTTINKNWDYMQSLVLIKARRNEKMEKWKNGKMYLLNISRRVFIYSFDRVLCSFTSEGNSQLIILQNWVWYILFCQLNLMKIFLASYLRSLTLDCK